ncbi:hypothetical protein LP316_04570 [Thalassotalea sp. LPB0316]|uniref:hypothetical protein n=1 Tax=Thalassotalea sp. LPB0316 TaxID=2769490 RepID=UPI001865AB31|nr:hypothetical protein [Thalassotalea sp. LPB0316]QOL26579.1 hypothetical protein LP316_04570 [Thalassotalea sp. LPB0316]
MKRNALICLTVIVGLSFAIKPALSQQTAPESKTLTEQEYQDWLRDKFANQHEQLIPVVAVADMFFACNKAKKMEPVPYRVKDLITVMDRDQLAEKLIECLGDNDIQSDTAINFGLEGCFYEQLADKPQDERDEKMKLVKRAIASLSREERQKSLTQCVTDQAIDYLK